MSQLLLGDAYQLLPTLPTASFDVCLTDPPYGLGKIKSLPHLLADWLQNKDGYQTQTHGFMEADWDRLPPPRLWHEVYRVMKPGGWVMAFGHPRTWDLLSLSLRLAGFDDRDTLAVNSMGGVQWIQGQGRPAAPTSLKPGWEPILIFRKPGKGPPLQTHKRDATPRRHPSNVVFIHGPDCTEQQCMANCPVAALDVQAGSRTSGTMQRGIERHSFKGYHGRWPKIIDSTTYGDTGSAIRFFTELRSDVPFQYVPKARSRAERGAENEHPTVKPQALLRWLLSLTCETSAQILDPFVGSGSTLLAAEDLGYQATGIEAYAPYAAIARARLAMQALQRT